MITLAIDTSTARGAVALLRDDKPIAEETFIRADPQQHLFGALQRLRFTPSEVGLIVVGIGPGSFTGIRAGIAAAKGLALPQSLPIKAVCSFDAVALTALPKMPRDSQQMCVLSDARRDEVYSGLYDRDGRRVRDCQISAIETLADELHNPIWFVSPEIERFGAALREQFGGFASVSDAPVYPSAAALGWLGLRKFETDGRHGDVKLEPIYLRAAEYKKATR